MAVGRRVWRRFGRRMQRASRATRRMAPDGNPPRVPDVRQMGGGRRGPTVPRAGPRSASLDIDDATTCPRPAEAFRGRA